MRARFKFAYSASSSFGSGKLTSSAVPLTVNGYTVTVTCTAVNSGSAVEAGLGTIYSLTATACSSSTCPDASPGPGYVERRISAVIER